MTTKLYLAPALFALGMLQVTPVPGAEIGELPLIQMQNDISYVTGGFGADESCAMKDAAGNYDLMLTFAERDGSYVADVNVQIIDSRGHTVLETVSGPLLLANLPAGKYRVRADYNGASRWQTVSVGGRRHSRLVFAWPGERDREGAIGGGAEFSAFETSETGRMKSCR